MLVVKVYILWYVSQPWRWRIRKLLIEGAKNFGIHLDEKTVDAFDLFLEELLKWNQKINLTAIRTEREIITKTFSRFPLGPSLSSEILLPSRYRVRGGFPGNSS